MFAEQMLQTRCRQRRATPHSRLLSPYFSPSKHDSTPKLEKQTVDCSISTLLERLGNLKPCLIQEQVADDPWKVLIAVTLLNKTTGKLAIPVFWTIIEKWPTPFDLSQADLDELISVIHKLGTQTVRSKRLIQLSKVYLQEPPSKYDLRKSRVSPQRKSRFFKLSTGAYPPTPISHLPGAGTYALDSYRIFCTIHDDPTSEDWKLVRPTDKELIQYLRWKWAFHEHLGWSPSKGVVGRITPKSLTSLIDDIEAG